MAVRKMTGSVEELMCVLVDNQYWEVFDGFCNKLGRIPLAPGPLKGGSGLAVIGGGKIVFIGGMYNDVEAARAASADVYEFNPVTNRWRKLADMNIPRYCFESAVVDGLLYVIRGFTAHGDKLLSLEVYNTKTNRWSLMDCPYRPGISCAFAFSFKSKLFVADYGSSFIDIYDPKTETWEVLDSGKSISAYSHTFVRNKVYFLDCSGLRMGVFDPEKNSWSSVFVPPFTKSYLRCILGHLNNKIIVFSRECEGIWGDFDKEDATEWRASPIKLSGCDVKSVLINF